ncbi:MAG: hypothetical protein ACRC7N_08805 [Clostridium sp.]
MNIKEIGYLSGKCNVYGYITLLIIGVFFPLSIMNMNPNCITITSSFIEIYGGNKEPINNIIDIVLLISPHIMVIYFASIFFEKCIKESYRSILIRTKSKKKWIMSLNIAILLYILKLYIILYSVSFIVISILLYSNGGINIFSLNEIKTLGAVLFLSVITIYTIVLIGNSLYMAFNKDYRVIPVVIILNILSFKFEGYGELSDKFILMNKMMINKYDEGSIIFITLLILVSTCIQLRLISKLDL